MNRERPQIPADVRRLLRQESNFGCAWCGFPFVEYHHIVPWENDRHFRPTDMMALCPTCHSKISRVSLENQYKIKHRPKLKKSDKILSDFYYKISLLQISIGGNMFMNCPETIYFDHIPLLRWKAGSNGAEFTMNLYDEKMQHVLYVKDNEFQFSPGNNWDFEFRYDYLKLSSAPRKISVSIDLRKSPAKICFRTFYLGLPVFTRANSLHFGKSNYMFSEGCIFEHMGQHAALFLSSGRFMPVGVYWDVPLKNISNPMEPFF